MSYKNLRPTGSIVLGTDIGGENYFETNDKNDIGHMSGRLLNIDTLKCPVLYQINQHIYTTEPSARVNSVNVVLKHTLL